MPSDLAEYLDEMKRAPSTTPWGDRKRCPNCGSVSVRSKTMKTDGDHGRRLEGTHYCHSCQTHYTPEDD